MNIINWFTHNGRQFPWRQTQDPFRILVAEVLLKLTGAWKAERVYKYVTAQFGTPEDMARANIEELAEILKPLGLYSRAGLLIEIAKQLNGKFDGIVPRTYEGLVNLKGIGQYTANAILCLAYDERVPLVDGSILRLFKRCFGYSTNKEAYADKKLWQVAQQLLPTNNFREYNLGLLDVGAVVCKHPNPLCSICPVAEVCMQCNKELETHILEESCETKV